MTFLSLFEISVANKEWLKDVAENFSSQARRQIVKV